ncbi:MAG: methyltransferase domain-containing protein [Nitrososphaerota archaeon]
MVYFTVIVATLGLARRPTLRQTLRCLQQQTFRDFEVITDDSGPNEYAARNRAAERARGKILAFTDDDTEPPGDWLENAYRHFSTNPGLKYLTGPVEGDVWGWGRTMRISTPYWSIGANMFIDREVFNSLGGFDWSWGLNPPPRGWRGDSKLLHDFLEKYGYDGYMHAEDVVMRHPGPMQSVWDPRVEEQFYKRCRRYVLRYIAPYDPRICQFAAANGLESDPRVLRYLTHDQKPRLDWVRQEIHRLDYMLRGRVRILDVGGEDGFLFAGTGWDYTVMDIDLYDVPDGSFIRHDADEPWPFGDGSFDVAVLGEVLEHVENPLHVLKEAYRVSRHMVLATVPNEYEWSQSKAPLITREERMRRDGFRDVDEMARRFASKSPFLRELYPESKKPHLWHVRWFDRESIKSLVSQAAEGFEIGEVRLPEWSWFTVKIVKNRPPPPIKQNHRN